MIVGFVFGAISCLLVIGALVVWLGEAPPLPSGKRAASVGAPRRARAGE